MKNSVANSALAFCITLIITYGCPAYASTYLGELCWMVDDSQQGDENFIVKLAVVDEGDNHFTVSGIEISAQGAPSPNGEVLHGNAEIVGDEAVFSISSTYNDAEEMASVEYFIKISTSTLSGSYDGIASIYDKIDEVHFTGYGTGSVSNLACP